MSMYFGCIDKVEVDYIFEIRYLFAHWQNLKYLLGLNNNFFVNVVALWTFFYPSLETSLVFVDSVSPSFFSSSTIFLLFFLCSCANFYDQFSHHVKKYYYVSILRPIGSSSIGKQTTTPPSNDNGSFSITIVEYMPTIMKRRAWFIEYGCHWMYNPKLLCVCVSIIWIFFFFFFFIFSSSFFNQWLSITGTVF